MATPIVSKCFCLSLRTAGLILGWFSVVVGFISVHIIGVIIARGPATILMTLDLIKIMITANLYVPWLVGIYTENPVFLLPALVWSPTYIILEISSLVILSQANDNHSSVVYFSDTSQIILCVFGIVISICIFVLQYSLYVTIRQLAKIELFKHNHQLF